MWTVTTKEGTQHTFGATNDPRTPIGNSAQSLIIDFVNSRWQVNKWFLTKSRDAMGNYISYSYTSNTRSIRPQGGNQCTTNSFYNNAWYYRDIRPTEIAWGGNEVTGAGHTMKVVFGYESRISAQRLYGHGGHRFI